MIQKRSLGVPIFELEETDRCLFENTQFQTQIRVLFPVMQHQDHIIGPIFQGYANRNLLRFEQISGIKFKFQHYEDFTSLWLCMSTNTKNAKIWTKTNLMYDN